MFDKGFTVWPVKPEEKTGEYGWNTHAYYADEIVHRCLANKFPNHNAAVISRRGIGNLMFLDIDSSGVLQRIEEETGQKISGITYSVCSRPQSAPYKRHFYFRQTARSVSKCKTENNVRDITTWTQDKNGNPIHPTWTVNRRKQFSCPRPASVNFDCREVPIEGRSRLSKSLPSQAHSGPECCRFTWIWSKRT
jgi:hypothetical protein